MNNSSRSIRTSATGSGVAAVELIAITRCQIKEVGISIVNATASTFALGRPAAKGITPTTPVSLLRDNGRDSGAASLAVAWGTGPTIPAAFYRQCSLAAVAGEERIWPDLDIIVSAGSTLILWTLSTVSIADVYFTISEVYF